MNIHSSAGYLNLRLKNQSWYQSVGIGVVQGKPTLYLYVKTYEKEAVAFLEDGWDGFDVVVKIMGEVGSIAIFEPKKKKSGFEEDIKENVWDKKRGPQRIPILPKPCLDPSHKPPSMLVIPHGQVYRHICPSCGFESILSPSTVTMKTSYNIHNSDVSKSKKSSFGEKIISGLKQFKYKLEKDPNYLQDVKSK